MKIERVELHRLSLQYVHPFETSFGRETVREFILVAVSGDGVTGWGECVAGYGPWYSYETVGTAWHVMDKFLIPMLLGEQVENPADAVARFGRVRGHAMARACLENAVWDLLARVEGISLATMLGGERDRVPVGVSVGIEGTLDKLLERVAVHVDEGYARVKLKIKPGWDVEVVRAVRERWPDLALQVDANSAYRLADVAVFRELDQFDLVLIEQPLHYEDIVEHAKLQAQLRTPVCLDESIHSPEHARWALDTDACGVINIKVGRVGGLTAACQIHDLCVKRDVPVWCGGMMETNVGRAVNVALSSLPNFALPGDISASARYFHQDIARPDFELNADSTLCVPSGPGHGVTVDIERVAALHSAMRVFTA
jgi:O-succinylbenzoate synthase